MCVNITESLAAYFTESMKDTLASAQQLLEELFSAIPHPHCSN